MKKILLIYQSGHYLNQKGICSELCPDGFEEHPIEIRSFDPGETRLSCYDLAIIHIHPDVSLSWELYLDLKHCLSEFSVLAIICGQSNEI